MSGRYLSLLERRTFVRLMIEREQRSAKPRITRLMRLKRLDLILSNQLRALAERKLTQMASAPRFTPQLIFTRPERTPLRGTCC